MPEDSLVTLPSPRVAVSSSVPPPVSMAVIEESSTVRPNKVRKATLMRAKAAVRDTDSFRDDSATPTEKVFHVILPSMDKRLRAKAAVRDKDSTRDSTKDSTRDSLNTQLFEQQHQGQYGQKVSLFHASGADI